MNWFYEWGGKQNGPVSDQELNALVSQGVVSNETLVWREGLPDWQPLRQARPVGEAGEGLVQCASCGKFKPADEIVQIGQRQICAACKPAVLLGLQQGSLSPELAMTERNGPAWEHRQTVGLFPALFATIKSVLTQPNETFLAMKREGGLTSPLLYFTITGGAGLIVYLWFQLLRLKFFPGNFNAIPGMEKFIPIATTFPAALACIILGPLMAFLGSFFYAGIMHVSLMVCGGARQPFETTYRAFCYGNGSGLALYVIPICGMMAGGIWGLICIIIGLARAHEIHGGRATLAVLLPMLVCSGGVFALVFAAIASSGGFH